MCKVVGQDMFKRRVLKVIVRNKGDCGDVSWLGGCWPVADMEGLVRISVPNEFVIDLVNSC